VEWVDRERRGGFYMIRHGVI
jgi:hypothetical protein